MRDFFWEGSQRKARLTWWLGEQVCKIKELGGLGIGNIGKKNGALLAKWWWRFPLETETLWYKVIVRRYGLNQNGRESGDAVRVTYRCPWKPVHSVANIFFQRVKWKIDRDKL